MTNRRHNMNTPSFRRALFRSTLIAAGLLVGLGMGTANTAFADASSPQPHSDGISASITDTAITAKVKTQMMGKHSLKKSDIEVTTTNGVVTLEGSASSSKAKSVAGKIAKSVDGVKSVDNNLKTPESNKTVAKAKRTMSDSWITTKVKSEILIDSISKGFKVDVTTIHGVVILKGTLANQDAIDHVKDIAAKVDSVKSVNTTGLNVANK